jgi:uncharacterized protein YlxW (UPF0749 family)
VFFAISIIIGFSIVVQAKSTEGMNLFVSKKTLTDLEISIESEAAEIASIGKRVEEAEQKLREYEAIVDEGEDLQGRLLSELGTYKLTTASTPVHGPGVTITLDDSASEIPAWADTNAFIVHDTDILRIISDLGKGGAEAISINGHRIHSASTIYCNGYTVRINNEPEARPFIIQAVGDPAKLSATLIGANSYGVMLKEYYGLIYKVQVETDIFLPSRPSIRSTFKYVRKIQEDEETEGGQNV